MTTPTAGEHFRAEPDDGRRFTYDPTGPEDATPWRVDHATAADWVARDKLPTALVPVGHDEWLAWEAAL
jgi:hypothetical protein